MAKPQALNRPSLRPGRNYQVCRSCFRNLPLNSHFGLLRNSHSGYSDRCRECNAYIKSLNNARRFNYMERFEERELTRFPIDIQNEYCLKFMFKNFKKVKGELKAYLYGTAMTSSKAAYTRKSYRVDLYFDPKEMQVKLYLHHYTKKGFPNLSFTCYYPYQDEAFLIKTIMVDLRNRGHIRIHRDRRIDI